VRGDSHPRRRAQASASPAVGCRQSSRWAQGPCVLGPCCAGKSWCSALVCVAAPSCPMCPPAETSPCQGTSALLPGAGRLAPRPRSSSDSALSAPSRAPPAAQHPNNPAAACGPPPERPQKSLSLKTNNSATVTHLPRAEHLHANKLPLGPRQVLLLLKK